MQKDVSFRVLLASGSTLREVLERFHTVELGASGDAVRVGCPDHPTCLEGNFEEMIMNLL